MSNTVHRDYEGEVTLVRKPPASARTTIDMFKGGPGAGPC